MPVSRLNMRDVCVFVLVALVAVIIIWMEYTGGVLESSALWFHYNASFRISHNKHIKFSQPSPKYATSAPPLSNSTNTIAVENRGVLNSSRLLVMYRSGRLGNEMWEYSALYGKAKLTNRIPVLGPSFSDIHQVFKLSIPVNRTAKRSAKRFRGMKKVTEHRRGVHDVQETKADVQRIPHDVELAGYYQSTQYFQHVSDDVRKEFTFRTRIMSQVDAFFKAQNFSKTGIVKVGIHIRHKELNSSAWVKLGFGPPPVAYYSNAMKYFQKKYSNVHFILCSDDIKWAREHIVGDNITFVANHEAGVDLAIVASCDHVIISNGTYSWWAGWLCRGTTVRYKRIPPKYSFLNNVTSGHYWPHDGKYSHYVSIDS